MANSYWLAKDKEQWGGIVWFCFHEPYVGKMGDWNTDDGEMFRIPESDFTRTIAPGECVEVTLEFKRVEK